MRRLRLDYFGTAWPPAHGLERYRKIQDWRFRAGSVLDAPRLVDAYLAETDLHAWLRARKPWRWAGNSIAVFDITGDAVAYRKLARMAERMHDPLTAAEAWGRALELEQGAD